MESNKKSILKLDARYIVVILFFLSWTAWWLFLRYKIDVSDQSLELFSATYGVMALIGAFLGFNASKRWGGSKSLIGKSVLLFSLGLLAQEFGQLSYSLYTLVFKQEIPYPSIGDVGYFGSVVLYIAATYFLVKALASKEIFSTYLGKLQAFVIPLLLLGFSYFEFLKQYEFDWSNPLAVILDFGYPLGQAIYISLAILVYLLSRKYLGGRMRPVVLFLIMALTVQYVSDFMFLYQVNNDTWTTAGINDYVYLVSYFVMSIALLRFNTIIENMKSQKPVVSEVENG
ncbi:MAG: hypothetical protein Q7T41_03525 [Candidatus Saccharibacteria bacterium]|nr:hypothetical protein [Candidatus Saccharibacteria bacterium]